MSQNNLHINKNNPSFKKYKKKNDLTKISLLLFPSNTYNFSSSLKNRRKLYPHIWVIYKELINEVEEEKL